MNPQISERPEGPATAPPNEAESGTSGVPYPQAATILRALGARSIVLIGMMGAGKTSVGRRLAQRLGLEFVDADTEIEAAHRMTISEIFAKHGEAYFRDGERRVLARLLSGGRKVIATGGGAFMNAETRARIREHGISVWLKADLDVLLRRVRKRSNRPLLANADPEATLQRLIDERQPIYALADLTIVSKDGPHDLVLTELLTAIARKFDPAETFRSGPVAAAAPVAGTVSATVRVELGARAYDIVIGERLFSSAGQQIAELRPGAAVGIVTDSNVAAHHLRVLQQSLDAVGIRHHSIILKPGETTKSYAGFAEACDGLLKARLERGDVVVALGGGVIGDLAGFAAACVRRGMDLVQLPTSLLAQVDSSVGGKTAINSHHGKNLIGAFHQPALVLVDTASLATLPLREFRAGYAEIVKYGLIDDAEFFAWLEANWRGVFGGGRARDHAIYKSCRAKAAVVARDERETGDRALLNLGHTFCHALERLTHYDSNRLVHGEGVAIGLACAFRFSRQLGLCDVHASTRVEAHLKAVGLPHSIPQIRDWNGNAEAVLEAMFQDKKVKRQSLTFILARDIGKSFIATDVSPDDVRKFLKFELERP
jgi:shikimate kinase/3-dehydroquinate synthase